MDSSTSPAPDGVIIDTNVLSLLAKIDRLDLLEVMARAARSNVGLYLTPAILDEVKTGVSYGVTYLRQALALVENDQLQILTPNPADMQYMAQLPAKLADGEAEAIALCHRLGYLLITHDRKALNYCERAEIRCLRLTTVLYGLHKAGKLSEAEIATMLS